MSNYGEKLKDPTALYQRPALCEKLISCIVEIDREINNKEMVNNAPNQDD